MLNSRSSLTILLIVPKDGSALTGVLVDDVSSNYRYEVRFDNIVSEEEEYTVTISTGSVQHLVCI